jgi:hypothetical protein
MSFIRLKTEKQLICLDSKIIQKIKIFSLRGTEFHSFDMCLQYNFDFLVFQIQRWYALSSHEMGSFFHANLHLHSILSIDGFIEERKEFEFPTKTVFVNKFKYINVRVRLQ